MWRLREIKSCQQVKKELKETKEKVKVRGQEKRGPLGCNMKGLCCY
jgi:hypothetical protein